MDFTQLMGMAGAHAEARIVQTAVELGIFDALDSEPKNAATISQALALEPRATELLLNALAAVTLLKKDAQVFSLAEVSRRYLLRDSPHYVGAMIQFESALWSSWEKLPEALRGGKAVRATDMYQDDPAETETFIAAMDGLVKARGDGDVLATVIDWSASQSMLDVGSGPATYPIALCRRFAGLKVTIFDLPATLEITERFVRDAGATDRIELIAGDYRSDEIPGTYDVIFLSNIIHGENERNNFALVCKLAANLNPGGCLIIKDHILDDSRAHPAVGAVFSLLMLLTTDGGRCYSFREVKEWLESAGLREIHQIELPAPLNSALVIGIKGA